MRGRVPVWYHPSFRMPVAGIEQRLGLQPRRAADVLTYVVEQDLVAHRDLNYPREIRWEDVERVHDHDYVTGLDRPGVVAAILGMEAHVVPVGAVVELWRRATAGTVAALAHVRREGGRAAVLVGGFHHAAPAIGAGFCAINDVAIAIAVARARGLAGRVVVLDLDAHPPDGTIACLAHDRSAAILSLSVASEWTVPGEVLAQVVDARLPPGSGDDAYLAAVDDLLAQVGEPEVAIVLAGADPLAGDHLGGLACTEAGLLERDRRIIRRLGRTPSVWLPAGGYTEGAWRVFAGAIGALAGSRAPVIEGYDPLLLRTRKVSRAIDPVELGEKPWLTEEDLHGILGVTTTEPRLLGYYTRHGVELALTRQGLLPHLERLGFSDLAVEIEADRYPHALRVTAAVDGERAVLVDIRLSVRELGGFRALFVEWLELRDPRSPFGHGRPRLPGQEAPGLGLAREVGTLLLVAAERVGLAGVGLVPAHFHIAWMGRRRYLHVDPVARGRFRALCDALAEVPLSEASALLDGPGLPSAEGPVRWEPAAMLLPASDEVREALAAMEPEASAAQAALRCALEG